MKRFYCEFWKISWLSFGLAIMVALVSPVAAIANETGSVEKSCPTSEIELSRNLEKIEIQFHNAFFLSDYAAAHCYVKQLVQCDSGQVKYHILLGESTLKLGELGKSIRIFRTAVSADPESAIAHTALAHGLLLQGDHDAALAALEKASQLSPNHLEISLALAMLYEVSGRYKDVQTEDILLEMITANPESDLFHYELGMFKFRNAIDDGGATEFRRALQINPDYTEAKGWLEHAEREYRP